MGTGGSFPGGKAAGALPIVTIELFLVRNLLPNNGRYLPSNYLETRPHATM
jgi:hypothetical protein